MKEEFLHYLWKYSLYDKNCLADNEGRRIIVLSPGTYNRDSGPDFFNARILIEGIEWAGNVEIHIKASHFNCHGHDRDHAFDNVILHLVAENDRLVINSRGEELLTVELKYDPVIYEKYLDLVNNAFVIACQNQIAGFDKFLLRHWLHSLLVERLQMKSESLMKILYKTGNDWDETFYRLLSRYFGFRVNAEPFEMLAEALPYRIIRRHSGNIFQIESLLFGTAGMLEEGLFKEAVLDKYYRDLTREYKILSAKYSLRPIHGWLWKFCRIRPANFPTVRISQLAALLSTAGGLFSRTIETNDIKKLKILFNAAASAYWDDHYIFGKRSGIKQKLTGDKATELFLVNVVVPLKFLYGHYHDKQAVVDKAIYLLQDIDPESNSLTEDWKSAGIVGESAFYTQALLQLTNEYCRKRRCLECRIGCWIISIGNSLINNNELLLEPQGTKEKDIKRTKIAVIAARVGRGKRVND
jgi:hypothetical protein